MTLPTDDLALIDATGEVDIETRDGERRFLTIIWVVVDEGRVFVRSVRGNDGRWFRQALADPRLALLVGERRFEFTAEPVTDRATNDRVSEGFRKKYRPSPSVEAMVAEAVVGSTLRLDPV